MDISRFVKNQTLKLNEDNAPEEEFKLSKQHACYEASKQKLLARKMDEIVKIQWEQGHIFKEFKELYTKYKTNDKDNSKFIWLTINPRADVPLSQIMQVAKKYVKRTFIKTYYYVYEQRGSITNQKEMGTGIHIHLLLERNVEANIKVWDIKKRTKDSFRDITDVENSKIFYYKVMPEDYIVDKLNYMNNKNLDQEHQDKLEKQEFDIEWRKKNKIQSNYSTFKISDYNIVYNKNGEIYEKKQTENNSESSETENL